jgi:hypothetical protein
MASDDRAARAGEEGHRHGMWIAGQQDFMTIALEVFCLCSSFCPLRSRVVRPGARRIPSAPGCACWQQGRESQHAETCSFPIPQNADGDMALMEVAMAGAERGAKEVYAALSSEEASARKRVPCATIVQPRGLHDSDFLVRC